jgi:squalene synthase HpnC
MNTSDGNRMSIVEEAEAWRRSEQPAPSLAEAQAYCRRLATTHYENFPVVSWLLPQRLHQPFYNVYAFCRWADDLGDEAGSPEQSLELLSWWKTELEEAYTGRVRHPVFVALRPTIDEFQLPIQPFADLISAFEQDQTVHEYDTFEQLRDYCRRSADPVGRIVLRLCGVSNDENIRLSDSVCTGLQLANFWQDVSRDRDIGRIYLPREDRDRFQFSKEDLQSKRESAAFQALMKFEVDRARSYLTAGLPLVSRMPGRMKIDIDLFIQGGLAILREIEKIEYRVLNRRPKVSKMQAASLLLRSAIRVIRRLR